jgi:plastocyanin
MHCIRPIAVATILTATLLLALAACGGGGGAAASISPPPDVDATVTAHDGSFDPTVMTLSAGRPSRLFFRNLDPAPHNVAIYTDASASHKLFVGDVVTDAAAVYDVPALEPGDYFFRCDVHTNMTGQVKVTR